MNLYCSDITNPAFVMCCEHYSSLYNQSGFYNKQHYSIINLIDYKQYLANLQDNLYLILFGSHMKQKSPHSSLLKIVKQNS